MMAVSILGIDHVQIAATVDREAQARWFGCEVLGLPEVEKPERLRQGDGVWLSIGAQQLQVGVEEHISLAREADPAHSVTAGELDAVAARPRVV